MRTITRIILHCSASVAGVNLSGNDIKCMHCNPVRLGGRGWRNPGYHYVVRLDGTIDNILPIQYIANGVKGYNQESIHICYVGGLRSHPIPPEGGRLKSPSVATPAPTRATTLSSSEVSKQLSPSGESVGVPSPLGGTRGAVAANTMTPAQRAAKAYPCFKVKDVFPEFSMWQGEK